MPWCTSASLLTSSHSTFMSICSPTLVGCHAPLGPPAAAAAIPAAAAAAACTCACAEATADEEEPAEDMPPTLPPAAVGPRRAPLLGLMATGDGALEPVGLAEGWGDMASGCWLR